MLSYSLATDMVSTWTKETEEIEYREMKSTSLPDSQAIAVLHHLSPAAELALSRSWQLSNEQYEVVLSVALTSKRTPVLAMIADRISISTSQSTTAI